MLAKLSIESCLTRIALLSLLLFPVKVLCQELDADRLDALQVADASMFNGPFSATFDLRLPASATIPEQGTVTMAGRCSSSPDAIAIRFMNRFEKPPVYMQPGSKGTHPLNSDPDGNYIVWRQLQEWVLVTQDLNDVYIEMEFSLVGPGDVLIERSTSFRLHRYPVNSRDSLFQFDRFRLATGKGYFGCVKKLDERESLDNEHTRIRGSGVYLDTSLRGFWEIVAANEKENFLVREATLMASQSQEPLVTVSSTGVLQFGNLKLAKEARLWYQPFIDNIPYEVLVNIQSFSTSFDDELLREVRKKVSNPLPPGRSLIRDYRKGGPAVITRP